MQEATGEEPDFPLEWHEFVVAIPRSPREQIVSG